jgi:hypothetical protein
MKKFAVWLLVAVCLGAGGVKATEPSAVAEPVTIPEQIISCGPASASRLRHPTISGQPCAAATPFARSYSKEDLESTGRVDLDEALSVLDPSVRRGF